MATEWMLTWANREVGTLAKVLVKSAIRLKKISVLELETDKAYGSAVDGERRVREIHVKAGQNSILAQKFFTSMRRRCGFGAADSLERFHGGREFNRASCRQWRFGWRDEKTQTF
jgi:hypothetical protein